ncbi:hypothetical protein MSG28_012121, partial [Choristoneura fumiferana]
TTTDFLASEHTKMLTEISELKNKCKATDEKVKLLESKIHDLNTGSISTSCGPSTEELIKEMTERSDRQKNIIIAGIVEAEAESLQAKQEKDKCEIAKILRSVLKTDIIPQPWKVVRIGKYKPGLSRPLKVCFESSMMAKEILRNRFHLILLTETWIKSEEEANYLEIPNYLHYYNYRTDRRGGGVSIYIHKNISHNFIGEKYANGNNYLWLHTHKLDLNIGLIYKPGDTQMDAFLEDFERQLPQRKEIKDRNSKRYTDMLNENGYKIINRLDEQYST